MPGIGLALRLEGRDNVTRAADGAEGVGDTGDKAIQVHDWILLFKMAPYGAFLPRGSGLPGQVPHAPHATLFKGR